MATGASGGAEASGGWPLRARCRAAISAAACSNGPERTGGICGAGGMKGGRHIKYPEGTPMANLLLTILNKASIRRDSVGDSTGLLTEV